MLCHPRGKKSELVVGDRVRWQATGDEGVIDSFEPRRNLLFRQDDWRTKSFAANLDQLLMLVAGEPVFSEAQLTRALVAAQDAGIPALIGLNKTDLPAAAAARERLAPYRAMGVEVIELALKADPPAARERLLAAPGRPHDAGAGRQRHGQEHAHQPAGAGRRGAGGRDLAGAGRRPAHHHHQHLVLAGRRQAAAR